MTNEYEQAVEAGAKKLYEMKWPGSQWLELAEGGLYGGKVMYREQLRSLLSLTWPSGQPMIAVLSERQSLAVQGGIPGRDMQDVLAQLRRQGFRRTVQKGER